MSNIKVSVIVPIYNVEDYLRRCFDSLVNQTLKDIEIVAVNDGSPDNSQAIIDEYAKKYPSLIKPFTKENGGLSDARNFGIEKACGEYLAFCDSDDYMCTDMLEKLYLRAVETDADVVTSPMAVYRDKTITKYSYSGKEHYFGKSVKESPMSAYTASSYAWNKLYKREFWQKHGFKYPKGQYFEDSALTYNIMYYANKVEQVNRAMYNYIKFRPGAITNTFDERVFDLFKSTDSIISVWGKDKNKEVRDVMTSIVVKHIYSRIIELSNSGNRKLTRQFLNTAYAYLNKNLPKWRTCSYFTKASRKHRIVRSNPFLARLIYLTPGWVNKLGNHIVKTLLNARKHLTKKEREQRRLALDDKKRVAIQSFGLPLIEYIQKILTEQNICCFADFGTMLGIVRENRLLPHDRDIDIGVILNEDFDIQRIHDALENNGFMLWRQYSFEANVVEESYMLGNLKLDLNFYHISDTYSKTWLFYEKPGFKYKKKDSPHVVEMTYSPIKEMQTVNVQGYNIVIPLNAEQILVDKYGENWRTPDTGWVYWQAPSATPLDKRGSINAYKYPNYSFVNEDWFNRVNEKSLNIIKRLQDIELDIVKEIDRVCKENGLTYYLGEGSLLGAMRHKGFIPWDDDVDILMPMADYKRLLEIAPKVFKENYRLQHYSNTKNYWSTFAKVRLLDNSEYFQHSLKGITNENGPYIDIFPLIPVNARPDKDCIRDKKKLVTYRKAISFLIGDTQPKALEDRLLYLTIKNKDVNRFYRKLDALYSSLEKENGTHYANYASYYPINKQIFPKADYGEPRYVEFNGTELPVPQNAEEILTTIYGPNWNRLPRYALRKAKHSISHLNQNGTAETMEII